MTEKQITLRPFRPEDQQEILEILTSNQVNKTYMLPDFQKMEDAIPLFNRLMNLSIDASCFVRCIALNDNPVGYLNDVEIQDGSIELGYVIHPKYHNQGFMTAALIAAIHRLFELGYKAVFCGAFVDNKASIRVMEKAGMQLIDKTENIEYRGTTHLCIYYEKRNEDDIL